MRAAARARSRADAVVRRLRGGRAAGGSAALERRVASLETAAAENTLLHAPLADHVTRLERDVLICLEQQAAARRAGGG